MSNGIPPTDILVAIGTRPEAIKMAPVMFALREQPWARVRVLLTAQHRELLDQTLAFSGRATDAEDGGLAASRLSWALVIQHCPSNCHSHTAQQWSGIASGSFVAPDHEYPSHLELRLTATDSGGASATTSIELFPETVDLTFASTPAGATITVGPTAETAPFTRTVIVGSANSVSAATSQSIGGTTYRFGSWSDGGAATHNITAPALPATLTATFVPNRAPTAAASATPTGGESPLAVSFDGSGSGDPDPGDVLTYAWDLDGDGAFDDATGVTAQRTYTAPGPVSVRLRATDQYGAEGISSPVVVTIADTQAPTVAITGPAGTVAGTQTVTATAGDGGSGIAGVRFLLDGVALGSEDTTAPYSTSWDTTQAANGQHSLTAVARDVAGNTTTSDPMSVDVQNGSTCPAGQWRAEYFANVTLTGSPTVVRCEQAIDNSWGGGGPTGAGVGTDNFSVRWSGRFSFVGASTSFAATADDGIRVRLDGTLVIDQWRDQAATTFLSRRSVTPGLHDVSVEYYERAGSAVARVSWRDGLVAAYSFDEASGATVNDRSATGNPGTISGASRSISSRTASSRAATAAVSSGNGNRSAGTLPRNTFTSVTVSGPPRP